MKEKGTSKLIVGGTWEIWGHYKYSGELPILPGVIWYAYFPNGEYEQGHAFTKWGARRKIKKAFRKPLVKKDIVL